MSRVYLDHAATSPMSGAVLDAYTDALRHRGQPVVDPQRRADRQGDARGCACRDRRVGERRSDGGRVHVGRHRGDQPRHQGPVLAPGGARVHPHPADGRRTSRDAGCRAVAREARGRRARLGAGRRGGAHRPGRARGAPRVPPTMWRSSRRCGRTTRWARCSRCATWSRSRRLTGCPCTPMRSAPT